MRVIKFLAILPFLYFYNRREKKKYEWIKTTISPMEIWNKLKTKDNE